MFNYITQGDESAWPVKEDSSRGLGPKLKTKCFKLICWLERTRS